MEHKKLLSLNLHSTSVPSLSVLMLQFLLNVTYYSQYAIYHICVSGKENFVHSCQVFKKIMFLITTFVLALFLKPLVTAISLNLLKYPIRKENHYIICFLEFLFQQSLIFLNQRLFVFYLFWNYILIITLPCILIWNLLSFVDKYFNCYYVLFCCIIWFYCH